MGFSGPPVDPYDSAIARARAALAALNRAATELVESRNKDGDNDFGRVMQQLRDELAN